MIEIEVEDETKIPVAFLKESSTLDAFLK